MRQEQKRKRFKSFQFNGIDEKGFTLLETMTALMVTAVTVSLVSYAIQHFESVDRMNFHNRQLEWHLFLNQLEYELKDSTLMQQGETILIVENKTKDKVTYSRNKSTFRRRKNDEGHQPMLTQVVSVKFYRKGGGLETIVTFRNDETYTAWIELHEQTETDGNE